MVDVDTFLFIGDNHLNGVEGATAAYPEGEPGGLFTPTYWTRGANDPEYTEFTPGGTTPSLEYFPWWDGQWQDPAAPIAGTVTASTTTTIDTGTTMVVDEYVGRLVRTTRGIRRVVSNTATTITADSAFVNSSGNPEAPPIGSAWNIEGAFLTYYHVKNGGPFGFVNGSGGSSWYGNKLNWGSDITMLPALGRRYNQGAPGFRFFKYATNGGFHPTQNAASNGNPWHPTGSGYENFLRQWRTSEANAARGGETLVPKAAFVCIGRYDIADAAAGVATALDYADNLQAFVDQLRADVAEDLPIVLVNHRADYINSTISPIARLANRALANTDANVTLLETDNDTLASPTGAVSYSTQTYLRWGTAFLGAYDSLVLGRTAQFGAGIRTFAFIGSSQIVGNTPGAAATLGEQPTLIGAAGSFVTPQAKIWDGTQTPDYDVSSRANTLGSLRVTQFGCELTLFADQVKRHPAETIVAFKYGRDGSALVVESEVGTVAQGGSGYWERDAGDLYADAQQEWANYKNYSQSVLGLTAECHGIVYNLGDNETNGRAGVPAQAEAPAAYAAKLAQSLQDIRDLFTTRVGGRPIPIKLIRTHVNGVNLTGAAAATIRAAQDAVAATVENVSILDIDAQELRRDNLHYAQETEYFIGRQASAFFDGAGSINLASGSTATATATGGDGGVDGFGDGGGATLIVEDGTGLVDANSYASTAEVTDYLASLYNPVAWTNADDSAREQALRVGTRYLDMVYGSRWVGMRAHSTQALDWPRSLAYGINGYLLEGVPVRLKHALAEIAVRWLTDPNAVLLSNVAPDSASVTAESITVGPISISTDYNGSRAEQEVRAAVDRLLLTGGLVSNSEWARR